VKVGGYTLTLLSHGTTTATNSLGYFNVSGINQYSYYFQGSLATDGWMTITSATPAVVAGMEIWINKTATPKPLMIAPFTTPNTIFTGSITNNVLIVTAITSGVLAQGQYVYNEKTNVILDDTRIISNFGETTSFNGDITGYVLTVESGTVKVGMTLSGFGIFATVVLSQETATSYTVNVSYVGTGVIALTGTYGANNAAGSHLLSTTQTAVSSQKLFLITNPTSYPVATGASGLYKLTTTPVSNNASTKLYVLQDINLEATNDLTFRLNGLPQSVDFFRCEVVAFMVSAVTSDMQTEIVELKAVDGLDIIGGRDNKTTNQYTLACTNLNATYPQSTHSFVCANFNGRTVRLQLYDENNNLLMYGVNNSNFARPWILVLKMTPTK
jgi:hypothetical protein